MLKKGNSLFFVSSSVIFVCNYKSGGWFFTLEYKQIVSGFDHGQYVWCFLIVEGRIHGIVTSLSI